LLSELSRRRIRSINKLIRVGRNEVVVVLRVDEEKGYIDLSKRRVSPEDIEKCEEKYNKAKAVHGILRHVAQSTKTPLEELYQKVGWPLYRKFGHAFDAFKKSVVDPLVIEETWKENAEGLSDEVKQSLIENIKRRLTPQPLKCRADIEVTCFRYEGIDAIKAALFDGRKAMEEKDLPVEIKLVAPPLYVMMTTALDKDIGLEALNYAINRIREEMIKRGGDVNVKVEPRIVSDVEDFGAIQPTEDED